MPSKSESQRRLMAGVCKGGIKGSGVPRSVACDYYESDKGLKRKRRPNGEARPRNVAMRRGKG